MIRPSRSPLELFAECRALRVRLIPAPDGGLTIDAPRDTLTPDLLEQLRFHKEALRDSVDQFEERAAIIEFDAGLSRSEAERLPWIQCFTL